jgi:hypothetical protein
LIHPIVLPSITVPAVVIVAGPVYADNDVPTGTPVDDASGNTPGLGVTDGDGVGVTDGDGVADGDGDGDGLGVADGDGVAVGVADGDAVGDGVGVASGTMEVVAVDRSARMLAW